MLLIVLHIMGIFIQLCLSIALYVLFYKLFEMICTKGNRQNFDDSDIIKKGKVTGRIILLTGLSILCLTIIINMIYMPLIGFYLSSAFLIYLGKGAFIYPKGKKIYENCWVTPFERDNFIVTLNDHKILIAGERLRGNPGQVIYAENSSKWLPPHDDDPVSAKDYEFMLKAILAFLKNDGVIQRPGENIGKSITKEDVISRYKQKGWKVEASSAGIKVSPPKKIRRKMWFQK